MILGRGRQGRATRAVALAAALGAGPGCPRAAEAPAPPRSAGHATPLPLGAEIVDAVDGARCVKGPSVEAAVYRGRTFYFCADENRRLFAADPARFTPRTP